MGPNLSLALWFKIKEGPQNCGPLSGKSLFPSDYVLLLGLVGGDGWGGGGCQNPGPSLRFGIVLSLQ